MESNHPSPAVCISVCVCMWTNVDTVSLRRTEMNFESVSCFSQLTLITPAVYVHLCCLFLHSPQIYVCMHLIHMNNMDELPWEPVTFYKNLETFVPPSFLASWLASGLTCLPCVSKMYNSSHGVSFFFFFSHWHICAWLFIPSKMHRLGSLQNGLHKILMSFWLYPI